MVTQEANFQTCKEVTCVIEQKSERESANKEAKSVAVSPGNQGKGVWWHWNGDGSVEFHDDPNEATHHEEGPRVSHFRSRSIK